MTRHFAIEIVKHSNFMALSGKPSSPPILYSKALASRMKIKRSQKSKKGLQISRLWILGVHDKFHYQKDFSKRIKIASRVK